MGHGTSVGEVEPGSAGEAAVPRTGAGGSAGGVAVAPGCGARRCAHCW